MLIFVAQKYISKENVIEKHISHYALPVADFRVEYLFSLLCIAEFL